jgi:hypothetical protein
MDGTNGLKETHARDRACRLGHARSERFYRPEKAMVGERPKLFGEALGFDSIKPTLIFGECDAVLVDAMMR